MPSPVLIGPQQSTPGLVSSTTRTRHRAIPQDLLREASHRLGIMCIMAAILWIVATVLWHITWPSLHPGQKWPGIQASEWLGYASGIASFFMWLLIRRQTWRPEVFLNIGLGYMILTCFSVGMVMHWGLPHTEMLMVQISWIGVVILMFAAVLPTDPRVMLVTGTIAAAMSPLAMVITHVHGMSTVQAFKAGLLMHYPDFLIAFASVAVSAVVTRLGKQVSKAREMGSYQLGDLIKRGGMGEIYKATHRMLARPAAIKLIRPEMLGGADNETAELAIKRFKREAEAAANLRSPHTVELFDFGVTEDNTLYFVMELLEGVDLETLVREHGPLPANRVIHVLRQVCESLAEAHERGLVHRDIKPANIHLGKAGVRRDHVKVLDFGLVKSVKQESMGDSLATAVGRTPGTPAYMAPEMMLNETIDARADIYALGCVGYYLLTGRLVFEAANAFQMIANHLRSEPVPPSVRANIDVPRQLEAVILKCLAKKQEDRYATVLDVSRALASVPVKPWSEEDAAAFWMRRQPVVAESAPAAMDLGVLAPT